MTDPIQSAMNELNEAVANRDAFHSACSRDKDSCVMCMCHAADVNVARLRARYNALIVAYGSDE